jgi:hypothetical protein
MKTCAAVLEVLLEAGWAGRQTDMSLLLGVFLQLFIADMPKRKYKGDKV